MDATWRFKAMEPGDLNIDPVEREFFATETLGRVADSLVREAIQNSLDAAIGECVHVRFGLGRASDGAKDRYLQELWPHVESARGDGIEPPPRDTPLTVLVVEDLGTRGLQGDPKQYEDNEAGGGRNDFYYFWRNVGRSRKESTDRGRWGLGKTVFAAASSLNAFLGLTVRETDGRSLLMGQAVLKIHRVGDQRFQAYGYYGDHTDPLTLPVESVGFVTEFEEHFQLHRAGSPGLSIVIPYPDPAITLDELVNSVLHQYFHPLLSGKLRVEFEDESTRVKLEKGSLEREIRRSGRKELQSILPLLELARWGIEPETEAVAKLTTPTVDRAPRLTSDLFAPTDLERLRRRYDQGGRIALDVPLWVRPERGDPVETSFRLLLERDDRIQRGEGHFVRQGITIENPAARRPRGLRWIVIISDERLSAFLGDAENPAHTEWQRSSPKFKAKYKLGPSTLDFVKAAPHNVASILSRPAEGRDVELLRNIFSLSADTALESPSGAKPSRDGREDASTTDGALGELGELGQDGRLVLARVKTGFCLKGHVGDGAPQGLRISAAYEVLRGNAFRRYSPLDFRLDSKPISVRCRGAEIISRADNSMELELHDAEFEILVTGFDVRRDLRIKVQPTGKAA